MKSTVNLPLYVSHKQVRAVKIKTIEYTHSTDNLRRVVHATITPVEEGVAPFVVTAAYCLKHSPMPGGYYVQYEDGYESWSPAKSFEAGYKRVVVVSLSRPEDCPRVHSGCIGQSGVVLGSNSSTCILVGCKHNHNPTHGGCGVDRVEGVQ